MKILKILLDDSVDHVSITTYTTDSIGCLATDEKVELDIGDEHEICDMTTNKESEGKTMTHNVEVTTTENKVIEEYWVMRAVKENVIVQGRTKQVFKEQELTHEPTPQEIAQFLSESKADFVSVEHNYRFADLPFC